MLVLHAWAPPFLFNHPCLACADGSTPLNAHCKLVPAKQRVTTSFMVDCVGAVSVPDYISRCGADMSCMCLNVEG